MKRHLSILICLLWTTTAWGDCVIKLRVVDYPPQYYIENGEWTGMATELAKVLVLEAGCRLVYEQQPWKRALSSMRTGDIHMLLNLSKTDERSEYMYFIGPQRDESMVLAVAKDSNYRINSFDDIKELPGVIGIQRGGFYGVDFTAKYKSDKAFANMFQEVTNSGQLVKMFNAKRIIGFVIDRYDLPYKIKTNPHYQGLKPHSFFINQDFVYFGLSKKATSPELLKRLEKAYRSARLHNKFEHVLEKYR